LLGRSVNRTSAVSPTVVTTVSMSVGSAAINNTMSIQIAGLAWLLLGERPGAAGVVGILIVSFGAFLTAAAGE
jgi:drug/metabolite transporter (DMT)-like permease